MTSGRADGSLMASITCSTRPRSAPCRARSKIRSLPMKAVIPKWIAAMIRDEMVSVNGDGETSRDFCYIENVTQANVLAATTSRPDAVNQVYNVGLNVSATLNQLLVLL